LFKVLLLFEITVSIFDIFQNVIYSIHVMTRLHFFILIRCLLSMIHNNWAANPH